MPSAANAHLAASSFAAAEQLLLGPDAALVLAGRLHREGDVLTDFVARQVMRRPGLRTIVRWHVTSRDRGSSTMVGVAADGPLPEGIDEIDVEGLTVGIFRVPNDPSLPALRHLATSIGAARVLGHPVASTRRRRYRPLTRAVVEVTSPDGTTTWVKAVAPRRVADLAGVHRRCAEAVSGPQVLRVDRELGLVELSHVPGTDLRAVIRAGVIDLPDVDELIGLTTSLAQVDSARRVRRTPPLPSVERSRTRLMDVLPDEAARLDRHATILSGADFTPATVPGPTVHGDLHAAQVQVHAGRVTGLVDLDDAGSGDPRDDLARFLAHLVCTVDRPEGAAAIPWGERYRTAVVALVPEDELRPRVAAVLMSLALGPHRVQDPHWQVRSRRRLDLVDHWLDGPSSLHPPQE